MMSLTCITVVVISTATGNGLILNNQTNINIIIVLITKNKTQRQNGSEVVSSLQLSSLVQHFTQFLPSSLCYLCCTVSLLSSSLLHASSLDSLTSSLREAAYSSTSGWCWEMRPRRTGTVSQNHRAWYCDMVDWVCDGRIYPITNQICKCMDGRMGLCQE